ncbi:MAG: branched-chain amino acid ABC transporter permease [Rhizobiales bacterium]|nr:branched-chain amino acid ABC transporter permease [Hyphomicrobiales bacterium]
MMSFLAAYHPLIDLLLLNCGCAFGQYIVLRAGAFSIANAGLTSIGAYTAAILATRYGIGLGGTLLCSTAVGLVVAILLSLPLARLRGVYQAIATLAFVQIVLTLALYAEGLTGGALGLNAIPKLVGTPTLLICVLAVFYLMAALDRTRLGQAFDAIRQDEIVAATLGVQIASTQVVAFALSGAISGLFGGLIALHTYSIDPNQFGFPMLVSLLAMVVLGGRRSIYGPIVGATILTLLPEIARPLSDNRTLVHGIMLILIIVFLPRGVVDSLRGLSFRKPRRLQQGVASDVPSA